MMFNEEICVEGSRADGASVMESGVLARRVDDGTQDAFSDEQSSDIERFTFFFPRSTWADPTPPQIGDVITTEADDFSYLVYRVSSLGPNYALATRRR